MKATEPLTVVYELSPENGPTRQFRIELDPETLLSKRGNSPPPEWAKLDNCKCPNCPLDSKTSPYCPAATRIAEVVSQFSETWSFEATEVRVHFADRTMSKKTDAQVALGSLMGLYLATSGCPVLGQLRPLVRFHLPFATELETIFRVTSMYLVAQFLRAAAGQTPDWTLRGLMELYDDIGKVNRAFATRLRGAAAKDANLNALMMLDTFAKALPDSISTQLEELRPFLATWAPK